MRKISLFLLLFVFAAASSVVTPSVVMAQSEEDNEPYTITLDPVADINPVKTQHTIIATVLNRRGEALSGQRVEWILARGGVGDIVEHDDMGAVIGSGQRLKKLDNQYTVSYTNERPVVLTLGTDTQSDDIELKKGQTWMTFTSPIEGETHVIAFCPNIKNANRHKAFAIKYWIDANIDWPQDAENKVLTPHTFKIKLTKASTSAPMSGYLIRWSLIEKEECPEAYLNEPGRKVVEIESDEEGEAVVELNQVKPEEGFNQVKVELRKPTGELLAVRTVVKTWKAPRLTVKKTGPEKGIIGENVVFNLEISNPGETDAQEATLVDEIPEGLSFLQASEPPADIQGNVIRWSLGTVAKDEQRVIQVTMKAKTVGNWTNNVRISSVDTKEETDSATIVIGAPEVYVTKEGPAELRVGQLGNYKLTVNNTGSAVAKDVVIHDQIPVDGMSYEGTGEDRRDGPVLEWELGDLQPGETREIGYVLRAIKQGEHINNVKAAVKGKVVHSTSFKTTVVEPKLTIKKEAPRLVFLHRVAEFTITITNSGKGAAKDIVVTDILPNAVDYVSSEPRGTLRPAQGDSQAVVTWNFAEIPAEETVVIKVSARAKKIGSFTNQAKLVSNSDVPPAIDPMEASAPVQIIGIPAMHISTYDTEDPCEVGKQTIYVIEARNEGTSPCTNVIMTNTIPEEMEYISASNSIVEHSFDASKRSVIFEPVPILKPGEKLTYKIVCRAIQEGSAKNTAEMRYDQFDKPILDEEGTSVYK